MVVKRILSCFAMISFVFLVSCYDVQLDNDKTAAGNGNWADGLSTEEIVTWMEVTAEPVAETRATTTSGSDEIEVSWECPINSDEWGVAYSEDGKSFTDLETTVDDGSSKAASGLSTITIIKTQSYEVDAVVYYKYSFKCTPTVTDVNMIGYFKIKLPDLNAGDGFYSTITSFVVFPDGRTIRVTVTGSEAEVASDIYCNISSDKLFTNVKTGQVPTTYTEKNLGAYRNAYFYILSDFSSKGISAKVKHVSNSSYCKVTKQAIANAGAEATLQYTFEDLPCTLKRYEPTARFDYNDIVFTVDILSSGK